MALAEQTKPTGGRAWTRGEKVLVGIMPSIAVLAALFVVLWRIYDRIPSIVIPTYSVPSPNAYDYYERAASLVRPTWPMLGTRSPGANREANLDDLDDPKTLAAAKSLAAADAPAIALALKGLPYPNVAPPLRSSHVWLRYYRFEFLAGAFSLTAEVAGRQGDLRECAHIGAAGLRICCAHVKGGNTWDAECLIQSEDFVRAALWRHVDAFDAAECREVAAAEVDVDARRASLMDVLREEQYVQEALLFEYFRSPKWRTGAMPWFNWRDPAGQSMRKIEGDCVIATISKGRIFSGLEERDRALIAAANAGVGVDPRQTPLGVLGEFQYPVNDDNFGLLRSYPLNQTEDRLLECYCAVRAYRLEHGIYPSTLAQLVPAYLPSVPVDPYGRGAPLRYRPTAKGFVLYSVGPDMRDDGGTAMAHPKNGANPHSIIARTDTYEPAIGDIVAGANNQIEMQM